MTSESIWSCGNFLALSKEQIDRLTSQGCSCDDWSKVRVAEGFNPEKVKKTVFSGQIRLGTFEKHICFAGVIKKPSGISNAVIHNCIIGNNVFINHVNNFIANYRIEDDAVIENINILAVDGQSSFGNGTEVAVVNEAGGRQIPIYDQLSAQTAYIIAFCRHRPTVIKSLQKMVDDYTNSVTSTLGLVGKAATLLNCQTLKNLKIGPACVIEGVTRLQNGSLNSTPDDPIYIGSNVIAEDFIACSGSQIKDSTIISKCFVGQGAILARQFSAKDSIFFANCDAEQGEACSIFAGPFTVTHHKSTLLIAGQFSFSNAGSGTNQSNHNYKSGPVHQGIIERGSKTASSSYILWPAKVGAFTLVSGRHYGNSDTSDLPFSYLIEQDYQSVLIPGVNLRSIGTFRDAKKWPARDRRKDPVQLDLIHFKLLSPYTIQKMLNGLNLLKNLKATSDEKTEYYTYDGVKIYKPALERGIKLYETGIYKFIGNCLVNRLQNKKITSIDQLRDFLQPETNGGTGKWLDVAGLFAPQQIMEKLLADIETGKITSLAQVTDAHSSIHEDYPKYEWAWTAKVMQELIGKKIDEITAADIIELTNNWLQAIIDLDHQLQQDAAKEFTEPAQIGYGIDGDEKTKQADFDAVRGTFEQQSFVKEISQHISEKTALANELISKMNVLLH